LAGHAIPMTWSPLGMETQDTRYIAYWSFGTLLINEINLKLNETVP
jgi:hypothetical protein